MPNYESGVCILCGRFSAYLLPEIMRNKWTGSLRLMHVCEKCRKKEDASDDDQRESGARASLLCK